MVISILGMSGMDREKINKTTAYYNCEQLDKKSGEYYNATDMLLKNYHDRFYFLGTYEAIEFQKKLLNYPEDTIIFLEIKDNSLDEIFEKVYELISKAKMSEEILLDITHGFRHQSISAIFSATLHRFLHESNLKIIFAKQVIEFKEYEYISLNEYIDITQLALLLTGFIRTLNFVESGTIDGFATIAFSNFSKALLSNDFYTLHNAYKNLLITLQRAKTDKKFDHLKELFEQIEETLAVFENFDKEPIYKQYCIVANLMFEKNYILLSLTYLFEAIRWYCSYTFHENGIISKHTWKTFDQYRLNQDVISFISQKSIKKYRQNFYDKNFLTLYENNKTLFEPIATEYEALKGLRNHLTHVNPKQHTVDIKSSLKQHLNKITALIDEDCLKNLHVKN